MPSSPEPARSTEPRASALGAFFEGWRRTARAPAIIGAVVVLTWLVAIPSALTIRALLATHLGSSLEADRAVAGWDEEWASEFASGSSGLGRTFTHEILGFGGTLATTSRLIDRAPLEPALLGPIAAYIALWVFLSGGILDRVARARPVGPAAFFSVSGVFFLRFVRLAVLIGVCYGLLFRWVYPWLFVTIYNRLTRDVTAEHTVFTIRALLYAVFLSALAVVSLVADFAKVRAVVEDRHSMLSACTAALRFVRRRPWRTAWLYLLNIVAAVVLGRLWLQMAPAAAAPNWTVLLVGQLYLVGRVWAKLAFMASEVAFFQGELAHAGYTAAAVPKWPDSPAVEALLNLRREG